MSGNWVETFKLFTHIRITFFLIELDIFKENVGRGFLWRELFRGPTLPPGLPLKAKGRELEMDQLGHLIHVLCTLGGHSGQVTGSHLGDLEREDGLGNYFSVEQRLLSWRPICTPRFGQNK